MPSARNTPSVKVSKGLMDFVKIISLDPKEVREFFIKHNDLYEITSRGDEINRAFVDLDGYMFNCDETDFQVQDETIIDTLKNIDFGTPFRIMTASKFQNVSFEKKIQNKLSYRITFLKKCGNKIAVEYYIRTFVLPKIKETFDTYDVGINFDEDSKVDKTKNYLDIDFSVYSTNRKMRCWGSSKPKEDRPNVIVGDFDVLDTCITYIPDDYELLPSPQIATPPSTPIPTTTTIQNEPTTTTTATTQEEEESQKINILEKVVDGLGQHRWENYRDFITIGMACFNEDLPLQVWERNGKKGSKNKPNDCATHWKGFKKSNLTQATLWAMLKQDNIELFKELIKDRNDFLDLVMNDATNYGVAQFIYNTILFDYLYDGNTYWWGLKNNSTWENTGKNAPPSIRTKIVRIMTENRLLLEKTILKQKQKLCDSENFDKAKLERLEKINGFILDFKKKVESDSFIKGVIGFLQSLYDENTKLMLEDKQVSYIADLMDTNPYVFTFTDCLYDFKINDFRAILPTDFISITCGYKKPVSNPSTRELLVQTLKTIWEDDAVYQYFIDIVSACMCGVRYMEAFFIATGRGGNGKGLIFDVIQNCFGSYNYAINDTALSKRVDNPSAPTAFIADLRGKRMVVATEPEESENLMESTIKKMTGGDILTGRQNYSNNISFTPQFGLFLQANNIPNFNSFSKALERRLRVIPFPFSFVDNPEPNTNERKGNPEIKKKYCKSEEWRNEMCLLLLENYKRVDGKAIDALQTPSLVIQATQSYTEENNAVFNWFITKYEKTNNPKEYPRSIEVLQQYNIETQSKIPPKKFKHSLDYNGVNIKKIGKEGLMKIEGWKRKSVNNEESEEEL